MIKAVFFDIDGTLVDSTTHIIPASTITALKRLRENGYKIGIASGRDMKNMTKIKGLDLSLFDGFVANNGMCLYTAPDQTISAHYYDKDTVAYLLQYADKHDMTLVFESKDAIYTANRVNAYVEESNAYYQETTPPAKQWNQEDILKITCFQKMHFDFTELKEHVQLTIFPAPTTTYDLTLPEISKLSGIHEMMQYWNLDESAFLCFGDHDNDIEMIQGAAIGVAVKDALGSKELQLLADDVCESAGNDGIYQYLKENQYI